jgi:hypothetical protein
VLALFPEIVKNTALSLLVLVSVFFCDDLLAKPGENSLNYASTDTFRYLVQDAVQPNVQAVSEGWVSDTPGFYDVQLFDTDGSHLRYGYISRSSPDSYGQELPDGYGGYVGRAREDDNTEPPIRMFFIWFDISQLPPHCNIEDAYICANAAAYTSIPLDSGFMAARADTHWADYQMLMSPSPTSDPSRLDTSFNELRIGQTPWVPSIGSRDDMHDFGPRGNPWAPGEAVSYNSRSPFRLDVADPIQQIIDQETQHRGVLFVLYMVDTPQVSGGIMFGEHPVATAEGNPCLTIKATLQPKPRHWDGVGLPVSMVFDDNKDADPHCFALWDSVGWAFSSASYRNSWDARADSLWVANSGEGFDFIVHSKTHQILGPMDSHSQGSSAWPAVWSRSGQASWQGSWLNSSSGCGGDRAGRTFGGSTGSSMCRKMRWITGGSSTKAMIRMGVPHLGHSNGRHS